VRNYRYKKILQIIYLTYYATASKQQVASIEDIW